MSAINMLVKRRPDAPDTLHMFGDVCAYDGDGIVREFRSKLLLIDRFPCVVATMGNMYAGTLIKEALVDSACFDDLIEAARIKFDALAEDGENIAVAIGGWSDARGELELYYGGTVMRQPFGRLQIGADGYYGGQPPLTAEQWRKVGTTSSAHVHDVEQFALKVLEFQRQFVWTTKDGYPHDVHLVGGWGELATVTRTESSIRKIVEWPDQIGQLIQVRPAVQAGPAPAANVARLSRNDRRAAKAKARRAA